MKILILITTLYITACSTGGPSFSALPPAPKWPEQVNLNWFTAMDPYGNYGSSRPGSPDFMNLFQNGTWAGLQQIQVFKFYAQFFYSAPDAALIQVFEFLKQQHIAVGIEIGAVNSVNGCGTNVEGMAGLQQTQSLMARIASLGGNIDFVAMDEPFYYGHYYNGSDDACEFSITQLINNLNQTIQIYKSYFPNVTIGDIEPFFAMPNTWQVDYQNFLDQFETTTGNKMNFVHDDAHIELTSWQTIASNIRSILITNGIPYGLIRNDCVGGTNSVDWVNDALYCAGYYNTLGLAAPDQNIFQTWAALPQNVLPETTPGTMTYFVDQFNLNNF